MLGLRKIVFYIFAVVYLILCPLIVARMMGFVISPQTYHMIKTGLVYVSTNPPGATVYIDGRMGHQKTPAAIRDLTPGGHFIRIELGGYKDWEKTIPIVGKRATVLANILLIPEQWPVKTVAPGPYQNIFAADDDILIAGAPLLKNIDIFHTTEGIEENFLEKITYTRLPLFSANSIYAQGQLLHLYTSGHSPFILVEAAMKDKYKFLWVNLKEEPPVIEDISDLFPELPARVSWDAANENIYIFCPSAHIYRINIKDKAIYPQSLSRLKAPGQRLLTFQKQFLINDKNDLILREGRWIRLTPMLDSGRASSFDIAISRPATNMYFEEKNGELFFLDDGGSLTTAQILPYHPVLNIPIPERLRIKTSNPESSL